MDNLYFLKPVLNKKKVIITLIIFLILLGICLFVGFHFYKNKKNNVANEKTYLIDNNFNITFSDSFNLKEYNSTDYFLLELHSENNLNIYISKLDNLENYSLYMIAKADSNSFPINFNSVSELSNINNMYINNFDSYNYNFKYLDSSSNITYYMQVFFFKIQNSIYTITVDFPVSEANSMSPIINSILHTIS